MTLYTVLHILQEHLNLALEGSPLLLTKVYGWPRDNTYDHKKLHKECLRLNVQEILILIDGEVKEILEIICTKDVQLLYAFIQEIVESDFKFNYFTGINNAHTKTSRS